MKNSILIYLVLIFAGLTIMQGCVKESFPGDDLGDKGTTFLKTPAGGHVVHWLSPFKDKRKVSLFDIFKDAHNSTELNAKNSVKLIIDPTLIEKFNEEEETELELLPADFYKWTPGKGVTISGNNATIDFGDGLLYGDFSIELDGSKWTDLGKKYALAFEIKDYGNIEPASTISDTIIVQLGLKNAYDGIYTYTSSGNQTLRPNSDTEVSLETIAEFRVNLKPGLVGYYSNLVNYTIDPVTNHVTVECPSLGVMEPQDARSNWDPEKKVLTVFWKQANGGRTFEETFTFKRAR